MGSERTVVLAEPDDDCATPLAEALGADGWHAVRTTTVSDAFQQAKQLKPGAVVIRGAVPGGGDLTLLKKLRSCAHTALLPVVVVVDGRNGDRDQLSRWGVQTMLEAPVSDANIVAAVRKLSPLPPPVVTQAPDPELGRPERLNALEKTGLLDSPPEAPYDRVAQITAHMLDVPVILLSLVDRHRQFFKAQVGVPEPVATSRQTPLSHSFCQWVVSAHEDLVVSDARRHPLLQTNGGTVDLGVVAYAGVPLCVETNEAIGSFCAIDMKPRDWDARELRALHDAATVVEGLTALGQATRHAPLTLADFRGMTAIVGKAVQAAMRLHAAGGERTTAAERHDLLALASDLGRQLSEVSTSPDRA
jgi:hypothetical protein